ncbi:hypothetical protein N7454_010930 [Penicillium verhagenii]|nr:hypothetical protein N7454_010930 [Penicillium verhagenii]
MPITEVGLLRFKNTDPTPETIQNFTKAQNIHSAISKYPTRFFRQVEEPQKFYITGAWDKDGSPIAKWFTPDDHPARKKLFTDDVYVDWMAQLDLDCDVASIPLNAPVVAITRYFVRLDKMKEFDASYENLIARHAAKEAPYSYAGGWRIGSSGLNKEFVLFTGWNEVGDYHKFTAKHVYEVFEEVKLSIKCIEIKQMRPETWEGVSS